MFPVRCYVVEDMYHIRTNIPQTEANLKTQEVRYHIRGGGPDLRAILDPQHFPILLSSLPIQDNSVFHCSGSTLHDNSYQPHRLHTGTQGNVGQALVSTPVQYRRKISRPSMYNSETVHRNCVAGTVTITDSIHKPPIVGTKRPIPVFTSHSYPGYSGSGTLPRFNSQSGTSLELISEADYRSTDCLAESLDESHN